MKIKQKIVNLFSNQSDVCVLAESFSMCMEKMCMSIGEGKLY
ncbi:hypothetical protein [Myroides sp. N17-2]|nr:hypothetical protein [Myroides sp. N17-2]